ncbi:MAG TPA: diadenylate cyclase [Solirubrobacterales bacterium]
MVRPGTRDDINDRCDRALGAKARNAPPRLASDVLRAMTSIDGAVLVTPDGACHAVGVILDGLATGDGHSARGARYNSAIRYLKGNGAGSLVIIVSEDGSIDLRPNLKRRLHREDVAGAAHRLVAASQGDVDFEEFHRRDRHIDSPSSTWTNSSVTQSTRPVRSWRKARHPCRVRSISRQIVRDCMRTAPSVGPRSGHLWTTQRSVR